MLQNNIGNGTCHQRRDSIANKSILRYFVLALLSSRRTFSLKDKRIIKRLQTRHLTNGHGAKSTIMDKIIGHRYHCWTLPTRVKHRIIALIRIHPCLAQGTLCLRTVFTMTSYNLQSFPYFLTLGTRLMIIEHKMGLGLQTIQISIPFHINRFRIKYKTM